MNDARKFLSGVGKIPNAAVTVMMVIITDKIDVKMSGRSQLRAERTTLPKYYAGECDYSE